MAVLELAFIDFWMNGSIPIIHEITVVLKNNKMKIAYEELREKLSDMAKNVPKSQKFTRLIVKNFVWRWSKAHVYSGRTQIQQIHDMLLKIHDKMSPK